MAFLAVGGGNKQYSWADGWHFAGVRERVGAGRGDEAADNKIVHGRRKA
jgi:hypothetical protein